MGKIPIPTVRVRYRRTITSSSAASKSTAPPKAPARKTPPTFLPPPHLSFVVTVKPNNTLVQLSLQGVDERQSALVTHATWGYGVLIAAVSFHSESRGAHYAAQLADPLAIPSHKARLLSMRLMNVHGAAAESDALEHCSIVQHDPDSPVVRVWCAYNEGADGRWHPVLIKLETMGAGEVVVAHTERVWLPSDDVRARMYAPSRQPPARPEADQVLPEARWLAMDGDSDIDVVSAVSPRLRVLSRGRVHERLVTVPAALRQHHDVGKHVAPACGVDIGGDELLLFIGMLRTPPGSARFVQTGALIVDRRTWKTAGWSVADALETALRRGGVPPHMALTGCALYNKTTVLLSIGRGSRQQQDAAQLVPLRFRQSDGSLAPWLRRKVAMRFDHVFLFGGHKMGFFEAAAYGRELHARGFDVAVGLNGQFRSCRDTLRQLLQQNETVGFILQVRDARAALASAWDFHVEHCEEFASEPLAALIGAAGATLQPAKLLVAQRQLADLRERVLPACCASFDAARWAARDAPDGARVCDLLHAMPVGMLAELLVRVQMDGDLAAYGPLRTLADDVKRLGAHVLFVRYEDANDHERVDAYAKRIAQFLELSDDDTVRVRDVVRANLAHIAALARSGNDSHVSVGVEQNEQRWAALYRRLEEQAALAQFRSAAAAVGLGDAMQYFGYREAYQEFKNSEAS